MKMTMVVSALLLAGALAPGAAPASAADDAHTVKVRLSWITSGYQAPFYLAAEKGWYKKAGLDVSIEPGTGSVTTIQLVNGGKYDAGEANLSNMVLARRQGMAVTSIAGFFRTGDVCITVPQDSAIHGPGDLKGKKIIFTAGSFEGPFIDSFLAAGGLKRDQVEFVNMDVNARNPIYGDGRADGMFGSPVGSLIIINKLRPSRAILFADWGLNLPGFGIVVSEAGLKAKPEAMGAFASAVAGAWTYIAAGHEAEAVDAIMKARPDDRVDADDIKQQLHNSIPFLYSKATAGWPIGVQSEEDWKHTLAVMEKAGAIPPGSKPDEYYTNDYLDLKVIKALGSS